MSDNFPLTPGSGRNAASDEVAYSGDTADVQLVRVVGVSGAEGSKTVDTVDPISTRIGEVQSSPTANTLLDRLKALLTGIILAAGTNLIGFVGGKLTYGTKTAITVTLTSVANGSARQSAAVDNTSTKHRDFRIRIQTKGQASGTSVVDVYVATALGDSTYTDGASGSDAAFTAADRRNSRWLGSVQLNAGTSAVQAEYQMSDIFATCPDKFSLIFINNSGAALSATAGDHLVEYEGIN